MKQAHVRMHRYLGQKAVLAKEKEKNPKGTKYPAGERTWNIYKIESP